MPYTAKQCAYFGSNPNKAPADWRKHCTKSEQKKVAGKKKRSKKRGKKQN